MKVTTRMERTVGQLIKGRDHADMKVNHEYQRGLRWTPDAVYADSGSWPKAA